MNAFRPSCFLRVAAATAAAAVLLGAIAPLRAQTQSVTQGFDASLWPAGVPVSDCLAFAAGDTNGDGRPDLVTTSSFGGIVTFLGAGDGSFGSGLVTTLTTHKLSASAFKLVDVDVDGQVDLLVTGGPLQCFHGRGDGFFDEGHLTEGSGLQTVLLDIDLDGIPDAVRTRSPIGNVDSAVVWQRGLGDGFFGPQIVIEPARMPRWIVAGDLDGDGLSDIVFGDSLSFAATSDAIVLRQLGGGAFAPAVAYAAGNQLSGQLAIADMDGDGHLDVLKVDDVSESVKLLRGKGDGTLFAAVTVPIAGVGLHTAISDLLAVDMDRDGRLDLVVCENGPQSAGEHVLVQRMGRNGPIGPPAAVDVGGAAARLAVADFDGDGLPDIASSHSMVRVNLSALGPFIDIGFGQSSPVGTPLLALSGSPSSGSELGISVEGLPRGLSGRVFFGLAPGYAFFHGGVLVPVPTLSYPTVTGTVAIMRWPAGIPAGSPVYAQAVLIGGAGLPALLLSNAVVIIAE